MSRLDLVVSLAWLGATLATPFVAAALLALPAAIARRLRALEVAALAALPACLATVWMPDGAVTLDWMLLGSRFGLDPTGRVFLGFTAFLWLAAGLFARGYLREDPGARRFFLFFLLSMAGNLGLVLAQDAVSFFVFFTLMSLAAYGLVVHEPTPENLRAGRVYIVLALVSEVALFSALALLAPEPTSLGFPLAGAAATAQPLVLALLLLGFGIKAGALPVHVWLPLAHPAAPTPASAVLSGAMIKAGLLGWLRFLPLGEIALPDLGAAVAGAGTLAAYYGVAVGLVQQNPKTVLAYSSISQMGFMTVAVGLGLAAPAAWPALLTAILVYALHHGLAKGALFLGVGLATRGVYRLPVLCGMGFAGLALAGAPLTSGALAKSALKTALAEMQGDWALLAGALTLAAVGTTLLMVRVLLVMARGTAPNGATGAGWMWPAGAGSVLAVAGGAMLVPETPSVPLDLTANATAAWPVAAGALLAAVGWYLAPGRLPAWLAVPAGDLLVPVAALASRLRGAWQAQSRWSAKEMLWLRQGLARVTAVPARERLSAIEQTLSEWPVVGLCLLGLLLVLLALLM